LKFGGVGTFARNACVAKSIFTLHAYSAYRSWLT